MSLPELQRPLVFLDIEATGLDTAKDRIVSLAMRKLTRQGINGMKVDVFEQMFNPRFDMTPEVIEIHHITNEILKDQPSFMQRAAIVHAFIKGCDLCGYNIIGYDLQILWEELWRAGIELDLTGVAVLDAANIFKIKEPRTLAAAVKFYCGHEIEGAHNAAADTAATVEVLLAQLDHYEDLGKMSIGELAEFSKMENRVDLAGTVVIDKDGDYAYTHFKVRGVKVKDDPGYARWMLRSDFSTNSHAALNRILEELEL